jgi:formate--tetrahydrofolate ligase
MGYKSDIEIAQECVMDPISEIAEKAGIDEEYLEYYGKYKAKISDKLMDKLDKPDGKLVLVTAINPTPAGEGKTTTSIGLIDALSKLGKHPVGAIREPSMGPVFGVKGGAAGGGYAQVVPMEDINLHFTGDMHAIGAANNLLAAMVDNSIQQGNPFNIDPRKVIWRRCVDMNDRQLRNVIDGLGTRLDGVPRSDGFDITVASEVMATFCLAKDLMDLKKRLSKLIVGYTYGKASEEKPVTAGDIGAAGAMTALLKDAIKPNLVQTLEHTPVLVHGGPFANIAHGCNSVIATRTALKLGDYCVTEAGFGADLGAEKFLDIKCRFAGLKPNAVVIVATVRALKYNGGVAKADLNNENLDALEKGLPNLLKHVSNIKNVYHLPCVVAINAFPTDTKAELALVEEKCKELGVNVCLSEVWAKGGEGGIDLAKEVIRLCEQDNSTFTYSYELEGTSIEDKLNAIVQKVYGGDHVEFTANARKQLKKLEEAGYSNVPICVAKTQYSLTDDPTRLGAPSGFVVTVRNLKISAGAGFIVALTGEISTMPGLPKHPAAMDIDVDENGKITGLF